MHMLKIMYVTLASASVLMIGLAAVVCLVQTVGADKPLGTAAAVGVALALPVGALLCRLFADFE